VLKTQICVIRLAQL